MKTPTQCTLEELEPYAREWMRRIRAGRSPRAKVLTPCPKCGNKFGARDLRKHIPACSGSVTVVP